MKLKNNAKPIILGKKKKIVFEKSKTIKPLVVMKERVIKVFRSETKSLNHNEILENYLREEFRVYANKIAERYAAKYDFKYNRIAIKDTKTRWGSCSSKKNINLNWRLIFTPKECIKYVVVHELAHTKEMNHSEKFWNLVHSILPSYRKSRELLQSLEAQVLNL